MTAATHRGTKAVRAVRNRVNRRLRQLALAGLSRAPRTRAEVLRQYGSPTLHQLGRAAATFAYTPEELTRALPGLGNVEPDLFDEAEAIITATLKRADTVDRQYPDFFVAETGVLTLLYIYTRTAMPDVLVETGVADGLSSEVLLHALNQNGRGALHSIDIADNVGALVTDRTRWDLHVIGKDAPADFTTCLAEIGELDMFFHDADHRYAAQYHEYTTAWEQLRPGTLLVSDDVDASYAFLDFAKSIGEPSHLLFDRRKVGGVVMKPVWT